MKDAAAEIGSLEGEYARPWDAADSDAAPGLSGAVAVLQCRPWQRYDGGDHLLLVGEVTASQHRDGEPLVFSDGRFTTIGLPIQTG